MAKKILKGVVVSAKSLKTINVKVGTVKQHPKYKKRFMTFKKYKADCSEENKPKEGDIVFIEETKPISKDKKWVFKEIKKND